MPNSVVKIRSPKGSFIETAKSPGKAVNEASNIGKSRNQCGSLPSPFGGATIDKSG